MKCDLLSMAHELFDQSKRTTGAGLLVGDPSERRGQFDDPLPIRYRPRRGGDGARERYLMRAILVAWILLALIVLVVGWCSRVSAAPRLGAAAARPPTLATPHARRLRPLPAGGHRTASTTTSASAPGARDAAVAAHHAASRPTATPAAIPAAATTASPMRRSTPSSPMAIMGAPIASRISAARPAAPRSVLAGAPHSTSSKRHPPASARCSAPWPRGWTSAPRCASSATARRRSPAGATAPPGTPNACIATSCTACTCRICNWTRSAPACAAASG